MVYSSARPQPTANTEPQIPYFRQGPRQAKHQINSKSTAGFTPTMPKTLITMEAMLWSQVIELVDDEHICYPISLDLALIPAVTQRSLLGQLGYVDSRAFPGEPGRKFRTTVQLRPMNSSHIPETLWRSIHGGYHGNGILARGNNPQAFGTYGYRIPLTGANFQLHVENHFRWPSRMLSPFLSATSNKDKAFAMCKGFQELGFADVQLLEINARDLVQDPNVNIWHSQEVVRTFELEGMTYHAHEYLIAHAIPAQYIRHWRNI